MPYQVHDAVLHAMSGTELSRVRTELWLLLPEPISQRLLESRGADIVMQSSAHRCHKRQCIVRGGRLGSGGDQKPAKTSKSERKRK